MYQVRQLSGVNDAFLQGRRPTFMTLSGCGVKRSHSLEKEAKDNIERITEQLVDPRSVDCASSGDACEPVSVQPPPLRDAAILLSFPGIGPLNLATLLTEATGGVCNRDYQAICEVAPVTKQSGKSRYVVQRWA